MSSPNVHVFAFNRTLLELLTMLEQRFPDDPFIQTQRRPLEAALSLCSTTAMSEFMTQMIEHGQQVDRRDEAYFVAKCENKPSIALGPKLWATMEIPLRDKVWDHVQKMKLIAMEHYCPSS